MEVLKKLYLLPLLLALTGCHEDFDPNVDTTPVLCLNSLITAGEPVEAKITHTWLYSDEASEEDHSVSDATLTVYANGELVGDDYLPQPGDRIRLVAESPTYGKAEAEVTVPRQAEVGKIEYEPIVDSIYKRPQGYGDSQGNFTGLYCDVRFNLHLEVPITDTDEADNYYHLSYSGYVPENYQNSCTLYTGTFNYEAEPIFSEHIGVLESVMGSDADGFTFFTDRQFAGDTYRLNLRFSDVRYTASVFYFNNLIYNSGLTLELTTVSPSYYSWVNYQWQEYDGVIGDLGEMGIGEPMWGYSNVSTGAGVVAACAKTIYHISLEPFLKETVNNAPWT